jgi:hypothetical protein
VPAERIELPTFGLQNRCSTAELSRLKPACLAAKAWTINVGLKGFRAKACPAFDAGWIPVRVKKTHWRKRPELPSDSIGSEASVRISLQTRPRCCSQFDRRDGATATDARLDQDHPVGRWLRDWSSKARLRIGAEQTAGPAVLSSMRVREEYCNMLLLASVALISALVAVVVNWSEGPQRQAAQPAVPLPDRTSVRLVGAPFTTNVNPRDRH